VVFNSKNVYISVTLLGIKTYLSSINKTLSLMNDHFTSMIHNTQIRPILNQLELVNSSLLIDKKTVVQKFINNAKDSMQAL